MSITEQLEKLILSKIDPADVFDLVDMDSIRRAMAATVEESIIEYCENEFKEEMREYLEDSFSQDLASGISETLGERLAKIKVSITLPK